MPLQVKTVAYTRTVPRNRQGALIRVDEFLESPFIKVLLHGSTMLASRQANELRH